MKTKIPLIHIIIVTLIVAILTAIIVPIVVNTTNSNNESAETSDEMTVDHLNEALSAYTEANGAPETLCEVWQLLEEAGYNPEVAPLYSENSFYYYQSVNSIVLVTNNKITYPSAYVGGVIYTNFPGSSFLSLSLLATDADAHDSAYANGGTCGICGATNAD